ncbi:MAG: sortase [Candidatus Dormibacteria bacterium]
MKSSKTGLAPNMALAYLCMALLLIVPAILGHGSASPAQATRHLAPPTSAIVSPTDPSLDPSPSPSINPAALALPQTGTGVPVGWLTVPSIGIHEVAIYDRGLDAGRNMLIAPGYAITHYSFSSPLGGPSNTVLYGHDDIEGGVFGKIKQLQDGAVLSLRTPDSTIYTYHVNSNRLVTPATVSILNPTAAPTLTLFSCWPLWIDNQRVVVTATLA